MPDPRSPGSAVALVALGDEDQRRSLAALLREAGVAAVTARDAAAAEMLASSVNALDLLVLDASPGGFTGLDLVDRLRALHPALRAVCVVERAESEAARADERRLSSPCTPAVLAQVALEEIGRTQPADARSEALVARLEARVRAPALRAAVSAWRDARRGARLPKVSVLGPLLAAHADHLFVAAASTSADGPVSFRFLTLGDALGARSACPEPGASVTFSEEEQLASLVESYQRAARTGLPTYERVSYGLGGGAPETFERLVLPASTDGRTLTHLFGIVLLDSPPAQPHEETPAR